MINIPRPRQAPVPINRTYSGPRPPTAYDQNWQLYTNLTTDDIAFYMAQPEWQNFVAWVALNPAAATPQDSTPQAVIQSALLAAGKTLATTPTPIPVIQVK